MVRRAHAGMLTGGCLPGKILLALLIGCLLTSPVSAVQAPPSWPQISIPKGVDAFDMGEQVTANGLPMRVRGFMSATALPQVAELFRNSLGKPFVEDTVASKLVLGRAQGEFYVTVQMEPVGGGTRGVIAIIALGTGIASSGVHQLEIRVANSVLTRFLGLMLTRRLQDFEGLLITRCPSVHSSFMRYAIDVVYLDRNGVVTECVPGLKPWRASFSNAGKDASGIRYVRASHTLELPNGAIAGLGIRPGDRLIHPYWDKEPVVAVRSTAHQNQRGSAMIEFTVVGPIITILGLGILHYGMLFFAKNQINHASFMAAREGSTAHADIAASHAAYVRALVPVYGGGQTQAELAASLAKASADLGANGKGNINIELLNPTKESFSDWNDPELQVALKTGSKRVIPNSNQAFKGQAIGASSGQPIQDANFIKLRITHGYLPKVPLVDKIYTTYLKWLDTETDSFHTKLVNDGRIPVVTHVTLQMQSDAIEPGNPVSTPGPGNEVNPTNPGDPPMSTKRPPDCTGPGCIPPDPTPPPCNPLTDPARCGPSECVPSADMCCLQNVSFLK